MTHFVEQLHQTIAQSPDRRITFHDWMAKVLYDPAGGFYQQNREIIGRQGDFFTAVSLGSDFGELLAVQFAEMWQLLGQPQPFTLVEMGAGQGYLAADVLGFLENNYPDCWQALHYGIIEQSATLRKQQQDRLSPWTKKVKWYDENHLPRVTGCVFSNELVDAFPVHLITWQEGAIQEVYVTSDGAQFQENFGPLSTPEIQDYLQQFQIALAGGNYPEGYRIEVNLQARSWLKTVAQMLDRGYVLTIDYGHTNDRYYHPQRSAGTLQCYYQHRHHGDPYFAPGQQDLTAHVNFTSLQHWGEEVDLTPLGFTQQAMFLMALGLGDRLAQLATDSLTMNTIFQRRDALHQLLDPLGLGKFGVLLQSKGLTDQERAQLPRGWQMPAWP